MKTLWRTLRAVIVVLVSVVLFIAVFCVTTGNNYHPDDVYVVNENWNITIDGHPRENIDLETFVPRHQGRGAWIKLTTTLSEVVIDHPVLRIYTIHSGVEVSLDHKIIYHYGIKDVAQRKLVGYGYHFIKMPDDYANKELMIRLFVNEDDAFTSIRPPEICNSDTMMRDFIIQNRLPLAINLFLLVFGLCLLIISICFAIKNSQFINLAYVALFSIGISAWSICNYDLIILFTYNIKVKAYLEFISLYTCPIFVLLYFKDDIFSRNQKWPKIMFAITTTIQILFTTASLVLQYLNKCHFPKILFIQHLIFMLIIVNMLVSIAFDFYYRQYKKIALVIGMVIFIAFCIFDLVKYNLFKYLFDTEVFNYTSFLCIGTLIFIITMIINFCLEISQSLYSAARSKALEDMAYTDSLTGIFNRRKCEEEFVNMDQSGNTFGMISFDLNNLKTTNDTKGHEMGDLLIRSFAQILNDTFGKHGLVCRMGGDEFIVLFPSMKGVNLPVLYDNLQKNIDSTNARIPNLDISTAYGFCDNSKHPEWKSSDVYREADAMMYQHKIAMKGAAR